MTSKRSRIHDRELKRLLSFIGVFGLFSGASYAIPGLELVRPWVPGEPVPLVHLALDRAIVTENHLGEIVRHMPGEGTTEGPSFTGDSGDPPAPAATPIAPTKGPPDTEAEDRTLLLADADLSTEPPPGEAAGDETNDLPDAPPNEPETAPASADEPETALASADAPPAEFDDATGSSSPDERSDDGAEDVPAALRLPDAPAGSVESVAVHIPTDTPTEQAASEDHISRPGAGSLPDHHPARGTPLELTPGALDAWFTSLAKAAAGTPGHIARALHWGDSTIAGDGITRTVRSRMQGRFGDGGPGYLAVQVDPRWASRPGVLRSAKGSWKTRTITFGGAGNKYYGLGGTVSTAYGPSSSTLGGSKVGDQRQALHRFDVAYQTRPDGGSLVVQVEGGEGATFQTASAHTADAFHTFTAPAGAQKLHVSTTGDGPVTVYGVAMETRGPGMTWETLGVAGAGQGSMFRQGPNHLARQIAWRDPDLLVYQMGGNELGYPSLKSGGGKVWKERYVRVVRSLRQGAPDASCLLITPLDQGERVRGTVRSKPTMATMVRLQRETAREMGCAFWDAQAAMGGSGSFGVWLNKKLAWSDLYHLTNKGLAIIGHTLSDAMEAAYDEWYRGMASSIDRVTRPSDG